MLIHRDNKSEKILSQKESKSERQDSTFQGSEIILKVLVWQTPTVVDQLDFLVFLTLFRILFNVRQCVWYCQVHLCELCTFCYWVTPVLWTVNLCVCVYCEYKSDRMLHLLHLLHLLWTCVFVYIVSRNQTGGCICCSGQPQWRKRCSLLWHCQCQVQARLQLHLFVKKETNKKNNNKKHCRCHCQVQARLQLHLFSQKK